MAWTGRSNKIRDLYARVQIEAWQKALIPHDEWVEKVGNAIKRAVANRGKGDGRFTNT